MTALTPYALEHIELLKILRTSAAETPATLGAQLGRDPSNVRKTLIRLREDGFLTDMDLTEQAYDALDDHARMTGLNAASAPAPVTHVKIRPDDLNPRKFTAEDEEGIAELAESIARDDLLENLVVRPPGRDGIHRLVAGERRWRAIAKLIEDGRWPADQPVPVKIIDIDDAAHRRIALVENLQRKDLRPMDEARALKDLIEVTGMTTAQIAQEIGFSQRFVQYRLQFLDLTADQAEKLNAGQITVREARDLIARKPKPIEDRVWLKVLEIYDRVIAEDDHALTVQLEALDDPDLPVLTKSPFYIHSPRTDLRMGFETGFARIFAGYSVGSALTERFGEDQVSDEGRPALLASLQAEVTGQALQDGVYSTAFLNGPFDIAPDILTQIQESEATRDRDYEAQRAVVAERRQKIDDAAARWTSHVNTGTTDMLSAADLIDILTDMQISLPIVSGFQGGLQTADGRTIYNSVAHQIFAMLINRALTVAA